MSNDELYKLIQSDTEAKELAAHGADAACAERCTDIASRVNVPVSNREVKRHGILSGYLAGVMMGAEATNLNKQVRGLCISVIEWIGDVDARTDFSLPQVQAMLVGLVASGLMTADQRKSLEQLALQPQQITADEVSAAMSESRGV